MRPMPDATAGVFPIRVSISELTTLRWDLAEEVASLARHRFGALSLWRTKLSDLDVAEARGLLGRSGIRAASLQWAGGFTGSDGRTFRESVDDALEAIEVAAGVGAEVLLVQPGCRGGHTLGHAHRMLLEAIETLVPMAVDRGVTLAIEPTHPGVAVGCGFMGRVSQAVDWVERFAHPAVGLSLDLWQFGHDPGLRSMIPAIVPRLAMVKVADRIGPPSRDGERLVPGQGELPIESLVSDLVRHGYRGDVAFELVGEAVEAAGYEQALRRIQALVDAWGRRLAAAPTTTVEVRRVPQPG